MPDSPKLLTVTSTSTTVYVAWEKPRYTYDNITAYYVGISPDVRPEEMYAQDNSNLFTQLDPETSYVVTLQAVNKWGKSKTVTRQVNTTKATLPPGLLFIN